MKSGNGNSTVGERSRTFPPVFFGGNLDAPGTFWVGTETQLDAAAIFAIF